ncbi:MAG TPA: DUF1730 domain-containing protein [Candidatus Krumholzibacteria bacterium]|nr:DUF1730 domain-containing protein [Candidatus Krumholzibacteria bacterium]
MSLPAKAAPIAIDAADLAEELARHAPDLQLDLVGAAALPADLPHGARFTRWLEDDRHGGLDYLARDPDARLDPTRANPWARTLLVFGQRYTDGWPEGDADPSATGRPEPDAPWTARVARYARRCDYHDVLLGAMKTLLGRLAGRWPGLVAYPATDTGPYLEREWAWLAGLGFLGRNTCLIHEALGSGLFLGAAPTNLVVAGLPAPGVPATEPLYHVRGRVRHAPAEAVTSRCGSCTACLDACPTGALDLARGLDAARCLSTWTIEWRGRAPDDRRGDQGGVLFGCDICQAVCPWNRRAAARAAGDDAPPPVPDAYADDPARGELSLADLIALDADGFRARFRRTPLWRAHPEGLRRNALVVAANTGRGDLVEGIAAAAASDDADTAAVARWALARLGRDEAP